MLPTRHDNDPEPTQPVLPAERTGWAVPWRRLGVSIVFGWFFFGGLGHFLATDFFVSIVPPWLSWPRAVVVVYVSGVLEIAGALLLLSRRTRKMAGLGLFFLTLAVTPANVEMWLHPQRFPDISPSFLTARLFLQAALLVCIVLSTQMGTGKRAVR